jgi:hypothetical protein
LTRRAARRKKSDPGIFHDFEDEEAKMARTYPDKTYRVISLKDGTFVVEIIVPGTCTTTTIQTFKTEAEAKAWIERRGPS